MQRAIVDPVILSRFRDRFDQSFRKLDAAKGGHNFVSLASLRAALPEYGRDAFDALLNHLRWEGRYGLSAHHGRAEEEEHAAGIPEGGQMLVYCHRKTGAENLERTGAASSASPAPPVETPDRDFRRKLVHTLAENLRNRADEPIGVHHAAVAWFLESVANHIVEIDPQPDLDSGDGSGHLYAILLPGSESPVAYVDDRLDDLPGQMVAELRRVARVYADTADRLESCINWPKFLQETADAVMAEAAGR